MSTENGQFATKEGKSRGTSPQGEQNPLLHVPLGSPPTPPNQPESRTGPAGQEPAMKPGRYEVWSGKSVEVGEKSAVDHPRLGDERTYHSELDPGHDIDGGVHRLLSGPRRKGKQ